MDADIQTDCLDFSNDLHISVISFHFIMKHKNVFTEEMGKKLVILEWKEFDLTGLPEKFSI